MNMIEEFLRQIFSKNCRLQYLRLDISNENLWGPLHTCLSTSFSDSISTQPRSNCTTLRHLNIRLNSTCFLRNLTEYVPNLEQLSVEFISSLIIDLPCEQDVGISNENWFNKLRKKLLHFEIRVVSLNCCIRCVLFSSFRNCNV